MYNNKAIIPGASGGNNLYFIFSIMEYEGIPILFVARDDFNGLYLCDCVEFREFQRWTVSNVDLHTLELVINKELSVFDALKKDDGLKIIATYDYSSGHITQEKVAFENIAREDLPEQGAYACMISRDAWDNLNLLHTLISNSSVEYSECRGNFIVNNDTVKHDYYIAQNENTEFFSSSDIGDIALVA